jgi:hypothetical protein
MASPQYKYFWWNMLLSRQMGLMSCHGRWLQKPASPSRWSFLSLDAQALAFGHAKGHAPHGKCVPTNRIHFFAVDLNATVLELVRFTAKHILRRQTAFVHLVEFHGYC